MEIQLKKCPSSASASLKTLHEFTDIFQEDSEVDFISAPGRTEICGNHTDHNGGRILAAAVNQDILAVVSPNPSGLIRVHSEGYPPVNLSLAELAAVDSEKLTSTALIRGVAARFQQLGLNCGGFDAVVTSAVPKGSGLSSSAAFEVLIGAILNYLYNHGSLDALLVSQIGQYSENHYFGKPCGLMDQTTSAVGGFVTIDFKDFAHPLVKKVEYDFSTSGYELVIVDTGGDHASLTEEYAAIEHEMKAVARALGGQVLRQFSEETLMENLAFLRTQVSDRAILRAIHFYQEDQRVCQEVQALVEREFTRFLQLVIASGESSWMLNQNVFAPNNFAEQGISIALVASKAALASLGAWRMQGGGFAGTIQAFVPRACFPATSKISRESLDQGRAIPSGFARSGFHGCPHNTCPQ